MHQVTVYSPAVKDALAAGRPVVALESTIISHGLPYPDNRLMALEVEEIVRSEGAVPATIGLIDGHIKIGLSPEEIELFASSPDVAKVSLRDLPIVLAHRGLGATTVATTATIASEAGIGVFVTGGIGGVHRGASESFDISADLTVLGRANCAVVSSGAKSVLDIAATLEYLETMGVTVLGYQTGEFPGFYVRSTGFGVDANVKNPEEAAAIIRARRKAGLPGSVLVAVPIPAEAEIDLAIHNRALDEALAGLSREGVKGREVTPFLLKRLREVTEGKSLQANLALIKNNAHVGARIAVALAGLA